MLKIITTLFILTISSAYASINTYYMSIYSGEEYVEKAKILDSQPIGEIVKKNSHRNEIELGMETYNKNNFIGNAFTYGWLNDSSKNNEKGIGVGANLEKQNKFFNFGFTFSAGLGYQAVKGKKFNLSTNATTVNYIVGKKARKGNYVGTHKKDISVFEIGIGIGPSYNITKKIKISLNYKFVRKYYDFAYSISGMQGGVYLSGIVQDTHYFNLGLNYKF